jgi:hypothetical protein
MQKNMFPDEDFKNNTRAIIVSCTLVTQKKKSLYRFGLYYFFVVSDVRIHINYKRMQQLESFFFEL